MRDLNKDIREDKATAARIWKDIKEMVAAEAARRDGEYAINLILLFLFALPTLAVLVAWLIDTLLN